MLRQMLKKNEGIIVSELGRVKEYPFVKERDFIIVSTSNKIEVYQVEYITTNNLACNLIGLQLEGKWVYSCTSDAVMSYIEELCAA